jgi:hypothetical protein
MHHDGGTGRPRLYGQRPLVQPACRSPRLPASATGERGSASDRLDQPEPTERWRAAPTPDDRLCAVFTRDRWDNA